MSPFDDITSEPHRNQPCEAGELILVVQYFSRLTIDRSRFASIQGRPYFRGLATMRLPISMYK